MDPAEVRRRRAEADARLKSDERAYERALVEHRDFIRDLREQCPHEKTKLVARRVYDRVCDDCGAAIGL